MSFAMRWRTRSASICQAVALRRLIARIPAVGSSMARFARPAFLVAAELLAALILALAASPASAQFFFDN